VCILTPFPVGFRPQGWYSIDRTYGASSVDARGYLLLPHSQVVFFKLVDVFEFSFKLSRDEKLLSVVLDLKQVHVVVLVTEIFQLDLVET